MENEKMFETAVCKKFRFPFNGRITVEDLFDLPVESLDFIFKTLNSQLKQTKEESLLQIKTKQDEELGIKIDIIKYIVATKIEEANTRLKARELAAKKQRIMEIMSTKQDQDLQNKSLDELQNILEGLD
jgi:hypothetical protein